MSLHRTPLGTAGIILGALVLLVGAILRDAARLLQPDVFADRVAASLTDVRVAAVVSEQLADAIIAGRRDLTAVRPLIRAASQDIVASSTFRGIARTAARRAHGALFSDFGESVALSIPDLQAVLQGALAGSPQVAAAIPPTVAIGRPTSWDHPAIPTVLAVMRTVRDVAGYAWLALTAGTLLIVGGTLLMRDRRDALVAAGAALMVAGVALWAIRPVGETIIAGLVDTPPTRGALAGLWTVALAGLPRWGMMYGGIGVVLAAAGSSLLERLDVGDLARRAARLLSARHSRPSARLARGVVITALGMFGVLAPGAVLSVLIVVGGLLFAFIGLREIFSVVLHATPAHTRLGRAFAASGEGWAVGAVLVVFLAAVLLAGITVAKRSGVAERTPTTIDACNGAAELCGRRLDEVVFAGTHNAMSAADVPTWMFPQQERGIAAQLEDGVRALLVDVHYGTRIGGRVRTELTDARRAEAERVLGPEGTAAAMRIRDRLLADAGGTPELFLCHGFCELGALPLDSTLGVIHDFLLSHPNEVVLLVVEDYVTPVDLAGAFTRSRLASLVYRGPPGAEWPPLRELIASDQRLIVLLESGRREVPWLLPAFAVLQETPFTFSSAADTLSCAPNRGGTSGTLLQINHWILTAPASRPSNATVVNTLDVLLERARRCEQSRGRPPNIIAVDFYRTGAVLRAARVLNGLERAPARRDSLTS